MVQNDQIPNAKAVNTFKCFDNTAEVYIYNTENTSAKVFGTKGKMWGILILE